jgi:nucleoside-diphosphate-sugar epimerase
MTRSLVIGASGYVGSAAARALLRRGHEVHGTARRAESASQLLAQGVRPVLLADHAEDVFATGLMAFDLVVFAAKMNFAEEAGLVATLLGHYWGQDRCLIFTSGAGVVSTAAPEGEWEETVFAEDDPFPFPTLGVRKARLSTEEAVRKASVSVRAIVVRLPLVWGRGGSDHVPFFFDAARTTAETPYLGRGLNVVSNVHVDDAAELYCAAFEKGVSGALYHAVAGEANFRAIAEAVGEVCGSPARSLTYKALVARAGREWVNLGLAINSRIAARRSRSELGWRPSRTDLIGDIRTGSYFDAWRAAKRGD